MRNDTSVISMHQSEQNENAYSNNQQLQQVIELPKVTLDNLAIIGEFLGNASNITRNSCAYALLENDGAYIKHLVNILKDAEDLEDENALVQFFIIFKNILLLNNPELIEVLLRDDFWLHLMHALESDPELPQKAPHRNYLQNEVIFNQVIPIVNQKTLHQIHQNFRIMYLKGECVCVFSLYIYYSFLNTMYVCLSNRCCITSYFG